MNPQQFQPQQPHHISPNFRKVINHLTLPLQPLVSMTTGGPHPSFPTSILKYHLLSSDDLDALAQHYHQTSRPSHYTGQYPRQVSSWEGKEVEIEVKRRRFGKFIGMRGCETPTQANMGIEMNYTTEEGLKQKMQKEWEEIIKRSRQEDDDEALRRKAGGSW